MTSSATCRIAFFLSLCSLFGCADFERGKASPNGDAGTRVDADVGEGNASSRSFATDVYPLLIAGCMSCHASGGSASRTALVIVGSTDADYQSSIALVDTSRPEQSRLLTKSAGQAHAGGAIYAETSDEYATMLAWVASGAQP